MRIELVNIPRCAARRGRGLSAERGPAATAPWLSRLCEGTSCNSLGGAAAGQGRAWHEATRERERWRVWGTQAAAEMGARLRGQGGSGRV